MTTETQQDCPMTAKPQREHEWLRRIIGEWEWQGECNMGPETPAWTSTGTERVRGLGDLWIIAESESEMPDGGTALNMMSIGYDPHGKRFTGTFVTSVMTHLWIYEHGELDADERTLTLYAKGPSMSPDADGAMVQYRDVIELKSDDHRVMTSSTQGEDGTWTQIMRADYRRTSPVGN